MKKSLMWMLTAVMAITFIALLYFQIMYLENMVKMREEQFTEEVMRSLSETSDFLERQETLYFLDQDINVIESSLYDTYDEMNELNRINNNESLIQYPSPTQDLESRYSSMQEVIRRQYLYQKGLLNEVIISILRESGNRPIMERADSTLIRTSLSAELQNNGINVPFDFAVINANNEMVYSTDGYDVSSDDIYSTSIFSHTSAPYTLNVEFPTKNTYIFKTVRFVIPSLAFTVMLLVVFVYTLIIAFRQKNVAEMKTDFINNMTHELKTPISTISLAGQMLNEPSIRKSESSLTHLADVIVDESKRLRFQVEKVLQLSVLDKTSSTLKFTEINANSVISNVVNTFKLKVEKQGGSIETGLNAQNADIYVDEMHFTNVIFNLLDNALKYMKEDEDPKLRIITKDLSNERLEIRISDNGIGIRKDDAKHIFEKFYRVSTGNRHDVKGFGLGLAYVKKMIEAFDGSITVDSEYGIGSTFIIILPTLKSE